MRWAPFAALLLLSACRKDDAPTHLERARTAQFLQKPDVAIAEYKLALDLLERDTAPQSNLYRARALRGALLLPRDLLPVQAHDHALDPAAPRDQPGQGEGRLLHSELVGRGPEGELEGRDGGRGRRCGRRGGRRRRAG